MRVGRLKICINYLITVFLLDLIVIADLKKFIMVIHKFLINTISH